MCTSGSGILCLAEVEIGMNVATPAILRVMLENVAHVFFLPKLNEVAWLLKRKCLISMGRKLPSLLHACSICSTLSRSHMLDNSS